MDRVKLHILENHKDFPDHTNRLSNRNLNNRTVSKIFS
ncbi:hypothetical protein EMIT047CA2_80110 [Pseudomonas soli]